MIFDTKIYFGKGPISMMRFMWACVATVCICCCAPPPPASIEHFLFSRITYFFCYLNIPGLSTVVYTPLLCSFLQRQVGLFLISSSCRRKLTMTLLMDIIPFWVWGWWCYRTGFALVKKKKEKKKQMSDKANNSLHNIGAFSSRRN